MHVFRFLDSGLLCVSCGALCVDPHPLDGFLPICWVEYVFAAIRVVEKTVAAPGIWCRVLVGLQVYSFFASEVYCFFSVLLRGEWCLMCWRLE